VAANTTTIAPDLGDPPTLVPFATAFEAAFATRRLKLATGPGSGATPQLWVIDFGTGGLGHIAVRGEGARFYAVAPMSRTLAGGDASIKPYDPQSGKLGPPAKITIASADLDSWMRIALGAIDLVLSPAIAAAAWRQEATCLNSLVASKQTIAGALRDRVAEILNAGSPDQGALAAAREALYQSMLVSLASAYTTDAVITYPVTVSSPFTAPYTTGPADGFDALASAYGVSPEGVAQGLADVPSILAEVTVSAQGRPYLIAAGETLSTLAAAIGVDVTALPSAVAVPPNTPLFTPSSTLAQSAMVRTVAPGDTFAGLAAFFAADPGSVGLAARLVPGLVPKDQRVTVGGVAYTVKEGDTLTAIAAALSQAAGHPISVPAITTAPGVVDNAALLASGSVVHCFSPANLVAPRLSGKASADQFRVAPGDGMAALVAWYDVSLEALADALAHAQILNAGAPGKPVTATWSTHSAPIGDGDTLATLTATLGAPDVLSLLAGLTLAPAGTGLLRPGIRIPLGRMSTTPSASDTFASLAGYFEDDPSSFAVANQDRPGVLVAGTELKLGTRTYTVGEDDTLVEVATGLGTNPRELAVAPEIGTLGGIFTASPVYDLQALPEFSLSTAKTPLANGTSHVAFLFGTNADASFKSLFLDIGYDVAEIETDIRNIPGAGDYQASEWLRLVVPLGPSAFGGAIDLTAGQTQVPIPLRAFALLPSIVDLAADAAWPAPSTIAEVKQWQLMAAVQHQSAAQDEILLEVTFGSGAAIGGDQPAPALFNALAQFVTAWPAMQTDVAALAAMPPGVETDEMRALVESLATLAGDLATGLTQPSQRSVRDLAGAQVYDFRLEPTIDRFTQPPVIDLFDLVVTRATEPDEVPWPTVYLSDPAHPLRRVPQGDGVMRFFYDDGHKPPAFQSLTQHYVFPGHTPGRDAVAFESGQVTAAVERNADLVTTAPTSDVFIYQTPWVSFAAAAVPFLQTAASIPIGKGADLTAPLTQALTDLLTPQGGNHPGVGPYMVRLLVTYERILAGANGSDPIVMPLPVVYVPQWSLRGDAIATLAGGVATQATTWLTASAIEEHVGDSYVIELSVFATAEESMTRPLVEMSRLTVPLA
ncbi:MAG TPA: LysM peptidoglycan-binding domain-containing protein, partial [Solirubrobacteraceae bacterium]|nr:LysM peptidoglycan-binding domain-containing protein [Solirubrobacteraceae bacterium]